MVVAHATSRFIKRLLFSRSRAWLRAVCGLAFPPVGEGLTRAGFVGETVAVGCRERALSNMYLRNTVRYSLLESLALLIYRSFGLFSQFVFVSQFGIADLFRARDVGRTV